MMRTKSIKSGEKLVNSPLIGQFKTDRCSGLDATVDEPPTIDKDGLAGNVIGGL